VDVAFFDDATALTLNRFSPLKVDCHTGMVSSVSWSSDGQHLASGGHDGHLKLWDISTNVCVQSVAAHTGKVCSVAWHNADLLASVGEDTMLKIWDFTEGVLSASVVRSLSLSTSSVSIDVVAWAHHVGLLAAGSGDGHTWMWDVRRDATGWLQMTNMRIFHSLTTVTALSRGSHCRSRKLESVTLSLGRSFPAMPSSSRIASSDFIILRSCALGNPKLLSLCASSSMSCS